MSTLFIEVLRQKVSARDGFLHVLNTQPESQSRLGQFVVWFAPTDIVGGAMKPHYCKGLDKLKTFLRDLGLTNRAITEVVVKTIATRSSSVRVSLPQDKIDLL